FSRDWSSDVCSSDLGITDNVDIRGQAGQGFRAQIDPAAVNVELAVNIQALRRYFQVHLPRPRHKTVRPLQGGVAIRLQTGLAGRSEERRVGKERPVR